MSAQRGMTLPELLVALCVVGLLVAMTAGASVAWVERQAARSAVYEVHAHLQVARTQAARSNRFCRFVLDPPNRLVRVLDLNDASDPSDDIELASVTLSPRVRFARPDSVAAVTLAPLAGGLYQATFAADGSVSSGTGEVALEGGDGYYKLALYAAGGVQAERWSGGAWVAGP